MNVDEKLGFGFYITIPMKLVEDDAISPSAKLAFGIIANLSNSRGYCFASNGYIGEIMGVHEITVSKYVSELLKNGYLVRFDEVTKYGLQRRLMLSESIKEDLTKSSNRGYEKSKDGINDKTKYNKQSINNTNLINKENKDIAWFKSHFDDMFLEQLKMIHKDKDIDRAIQESYAHLLADGIDTADTQRCKKLLNTWLINTKGGRVVSDEELFKNL